ncbi:MAG: hypothetical protein IIA01_02755 [Proteobacteria bacterium]|nr:hypothetical protein [Pseudomonadota bacterium]
MSDAPPSNLHRYPPRTLVADYARAGLGMALTLGPLAFFNAETVMVYILGGLGALFGAFGLRTFLRHMTHVEISPGEIRMRGPVGRGLRWQGLDELTLKYYTTQRDKHGGWMELKLKGDGCVLTIDSSIEGFADIAGEALAAARAIRLPLGDDTRANLAALGLAPDDDPAERA